MTEIINTKDAPAAVGPYSQAVKKGNMIFVSGQIPFDPETMELVSDDIKEQTEQSLKNVKAILAAAGATLDNVVKTRIYLDDMEQFCNVNEVYARFFNSKLPARVCMEVSRLPKDVKIEVEVTAIV